MEVLKSLGITDRDIRKISVEVADSIVLMQMKKPLRQI